MNEVKIILGCYKRIHKIADEILGPLGKPTRKRGVRVIGYREVGLARFKMYVIR